MDPWNNLLREMYDAVVEVIEKIFASLAMVVAPVRPSLLLALATMTTAIAVLSDEFNLFGWYSAFVCWGLYTTKRIVEKRRPGKNAPDRTAPENSNVHDKKDHDDSNSSRFAMKWPK